jgi:phosphohistidine phosphatase
VLCSPARRTRQTWLLASEAVKKALKEAPPAARFADVLYGASVEELINLIRQVPAASGTSLVIGHEPTMSATARALAGPESNQADLNRLAAKYPTSGMAVFRLEPDWIDLAPGAAVLEQFLIPRG